MLHAAQIHSYTPSLAPVMVCAFSLLSSGVVQAEHGPGARQLRAFDAAAADSLATHRPCASGAQRNRAGHEGVRKTYGIGGQKAAAGFQRDPKAAQLEAQQHCGQRTAEPARVPGASTRRSERRTPGPYSIAGTSKIR